MARRQGIRFSPEVTWLIPFVRASKPLIDFRHIKRISGYRLKTRLVPSSVGTISRWEDGHYTIRIRLNELLYPYGVTEFSSWTILSTLAHELAHTKQWQHTPAHMRLEARIMLRFATVCAKLGIKNTWSQRRPK